MTLPDLKSLSDEALHSGVLALRGRECAAIAEVVRYLFEINARGIYRDAGYASLFTYCTKYLDYAEASAWRRVEAVKAMARSADIYERIRTGKLTLCAVGTVGKVLTEENKSEVLDLS